MPRRDGTGPMGMGAMTGRGAGFCSGVAVQGGMNGSGRFGGFGCRRGMGVMMRGAGMQTHNQFFNAPFVEPSFTAPNEKEVLTNQAKYLEQQLQQVKQRLEKFTTEPV